MNIFQLLGEARGLPKIDWPVGTRFRDWEGDEGTIAEYPADGTLVVQYDGFPGTTTFDAQYNPINRGKPLFVRLPDAPRTQD